MEKSGFKMTRATAVLIIIAAAVAATAAVIVRGMPDGVNSGTQSLINASTAAGREKYLENLGWEIDPASEQAQDIVLPDKFGAVMSEYNKLQKQQGFDLSLFSGLECRQYTYAVTNYPEPDAGDVLATLYVHGRQVIGGDIHSAGINGFMHALK
jgi:hypothetical protein